jgi:hypothetical protein
MLLSHLRNGASAVIFYVNNMNQEGQLPFTNIKRTHMHFPGNSTLCSGGAKLNQDLFRIAGQFSFGVDGDHVMHCAMPATSAYMP